MLVVKYLDCYLKSLTAGNFTRDQGGAPNIRLIGVSAATIVARAAL